MRFYRPLGQISALTFDLDDTLYDNRPVIDRTLHESLAFVRSYHPSLSQFDANELNSCVRRCWRQSRRFTTT
jgi:putative hydrolase of the HAD superfamily